jgi:predicted nucleic acid-binding Zn ribbon protein
MAEKVTQHAHCHICGKAIPLTETLCSEECRQKYNLMLKKRKMLVYVMYALIFFILAMYLITNFLR